MKSLKLSLSLKAEQQERYVKLPFELPDGVEELKISYSYDRTELSRRDGAVFENGEAVVDFALEAPGGRFVGASGSDRESVTVSPHGSSSGFASMEVCRGGWTIIAGAYRIPEGGLDVEYIVELVYKKRRLFKGDTHVHTIASDGNCSVSGIVSLAEKRGLDFVFITNHNNFLSERDLPAAPPVTVIPGTEWTHYRGHAGLLGEREAYSLPYYADDEAQAGMILSQASESGAFVVLNHPFCPQVPWKWSFGLAHHGVEIWNGVMSERNERAVAWWHSRLAAGESVVAVGGSDYHRQGLFQALAMPCQNLWAESRSRDDIMASLRRGCGFISYQPDGP